MSQSQTTDQPTAPRGRDTEQRHPYYSNNILQMISPPKPYVELN